VHRDLLQAAVTANPLSGNAQSLERGIALWKANCQACHGAEGRGDGPVTAALRKKPKDLTRIARPPIFPDGVLAYRIANGGEVMPAWKGALAEQDIWDLVNYIRAQRP
jgi:mono/diheme cytochrome c family protein